jgi:pilus assembly protein CpaF
MIKPDKKEELEAKAMIIGRNRSESPLSRAERRHMPRQRVVWTATLERPRGPMPCRISNLSAGGARLRVSHPVGVGETVTIITPAAGTFGGIVAWERDGAIGVRFDKDGGVSGNQDPASLRASFADPSPDKTIAFSARRPVDDADGERTARVRLYGRSDADRDNPISRLDAPAPAPSSGDTNQRIEAAVAVLHPDLNEQIDPKVAVQLPRSELGRQLGDLVREAARKRHLLLSRSEQAAVVERVLDEMLGLGPLEPLLADDSVTDILVNGAKQVYVERGGRLEPTEITFFDDSHVMNIALRIVNKIGRRLDESVPLVDARLADGSRVNVIIPPLALKAPMISIRKFAKQSITLETMARQQNMSPAMAVLLKIAARCRLNVLISGGTGSGKTTLLNAMSQMIDPSERIITIEDAAELQLQLPHIASLETRPANFEGGGEVTMRDLFRNALRMRPDRIILGEVRGPEAFDMLQAMNTGHDGSLATIHASGPREALTRLESIICMCGMDIPSQAVRSQIAQSLDLIVQVCRMRDGKRRVTSITEVVGQDQSVLLTQELFRYEFEEETSGGELIGRFVHTGIRPHFMPKAEYHGLHRILSQLIAGPTGVRIEAPGLARS